MFKNLDKIQQLVLDLQKVQRHHYIPDTNDLENVIEHSFSVALISWYLFHRTKSALNLTRILQYSLLHDSLERGLAKDISSYASTKDRQLKKQREAQVLIDLKSEFDYFPDFIKTLEDYENLVDEEARFVYVIDKIQAIIHGYMQDWRPYKEGNISFQQFHEKGENILSYCPKDLEDIIRPLLETSYRVYYTQQ
jgi:5'-deoxynucleotidase YfbR-like HD superfamily hydrolase